MPSLLELNQLQNLSPELRLAIVTMQYRELAGKAQGFDPAVHAASLLAQGELVGFRAELLQLELLTKNLRDIGTSRPAVAATLRSRLMRKTGDLSNYVGWRMEARIASSLTRKDLEFEYDDAPDFTVKLGGDVVAIECTSTNVDPATAPDKDLGYKITSAVRKKGRMAYADGTLAIAIDLSGILKIRQGQTVDRDDHEALLKATCSDSLAGTVLLFHTVLQPETNRVEFIYSRHDAPGISPVLTKFMDQHYPRDPERRYGVFYA